MSTFNVQFVLAGDHDAARAALRAALEAEGFTVKEEHHGEWKAIHGSAAKTIFLGVFANNSDTREVFAVKFAEDGGNLVAQLHRGLLQIGAGADDGMEMIRLNEAYEQSEVALANRLSAAGVLVKANL